LLKQSYVRLDHTYEAPASMLRRYGFQRSRAYKMRLTEKSYVTLMQNLSMVPEVYPKTKTVRKTSKQRLLVLARSGGNTGDAIGLPVTSNPVPGDLMYLSSDHASSKPSDIQPVLSESRPSMVSALHSLGPIPVRTYPGDYESHYLYNHAQFTGNYRDSRESVVGEGWLAFLSRKLLALLSLARWWV
jgi:hypothetical protein